MRLSLYMKPMAIKVVFKSIIEKSWNTGNVITLYIRNRQANCIEHVDGCSISNSIFALWSLRDSRIVFLDQTKLFSWYNWS
jgi:hypothetical protein